METLCRLSYGGESSEVRGYTCARARLTSLPGAPTPTSSPRDAPVEPGRAPSPEALQRHQARVAPARGATDAEDMGNATSTSVRRWTAADLPDLTGRRFLVTGATSGLGLHTALALGRAGASVLLTARDPRRGQATLETVQAAARHPQQIALGMLDLADLSSVRTFAATVTEPVDVLINNAGVMAIPRLETVDGFEMQLATNHLGHFALTGLLLDRLLAGNQPRVVNVASSAHRMGRIDLTDLHGTRRYSPWPAYGASKLANLLFTAELDRRATTAGTPLRAMAAHPGFAATNLQYVAGEMTGASATRQNLTRTVTNLVAQSAEQGAWPTLFAAVMDLPGNTYIGPDGPFEARGYPKIVGRSSAARDTALARGLWDESERLTGIHYSALT